MSTAVGLLVSAETDLSSCLAATQRIARALRRPVSVLVRGTDDCVVTQVTRSRVRELNQSVERSERVRVTPIGTEDGALTAAAQRLRLLVIPAVEDDSVDSGLLQRLQCTTMQLTISAEQSVDWKRVVLVDSADPDRRLRQLADRIADLSEGEVVQVIAESAEPTADDDSYQPDDLVLLVIDAEEENGQDVTARIRQTAPEAAVARVLVGHSAVRRAYAAFEQVVQRVVPQLEREKRRELAKELHEGSAADFDFVAMIAASATLASFGLVQGSAAVIIGAMLIAPLMTPILGIGLSLVHANQPLFTQALRTVLVGFLFAFLASVVVGLVARVTMASQITHEMWTRSHPGLLDFLVGFVGGGAAAYARTRDKLSSALAGAAIAAALVPPIATAGLQLALWPIPEDQWQGVPVAGPLLLFLVNVLSISVAAAMSLWSAGARGYHHHGDYQPWATRMSVLLLLLISAVLVLVNRLAW